MSTLLNENMTGLGTGVYLAPTDADLRLRGDHVPGATYGAFASDITTGFVASS